MNDAQGSLLDLPPASEWVAADRRGKARRSDPETSSQAAALPGKGTLRWACLVALGRAGEHGLTDFELAARVGRQQTSAGKRRGELVEARLVEQTDEKRRAPSGANALVWRITEHGRAVLTQREAA